MANRNRQNRGASPVRQEAAAMRRWQWEAKTAAMAEGRRERATTYKRVANKRACRDRKHWS
jgi:hypothetical protein